MEGVEQDGGMEREAIVHICAASMDAPPCAVRRVAWLGIVVDVAVRVPRVQVSNHEESTQSDDCMQHQGRRRTLSLLKFDELGWPRQDYLV
jgi:hypothetical protein